MTLPITQSQFTPAIIGLGAGEPNQAVFPLKMLWRAAEARFAQGDPSFLQYGIEQGDGYFRLALAQFLSREYGQPVNPENIFVTAGVSSALDLLCTLFTQAGDTRHCVGYTLVVRRDDNARNPRRRQRSLHRVNYQRLPRNIAQHLARRTRRSVPCRYYRDHILLGILTVMLHGILGYSVSAKIATRRYAKLACGGRLATLS